MENDFIDESILFAFEEYMKKGNADFEKKARFYSLEYASKLNPLNADCLIFEADKILKWIMNNSK